MMPHSQHFRSDRRGRSTLEFTFAAMVLAAGVLLMSQSKGTYLPDHMTALVQRFLPFETLTKLAALHPAPSSGCAGFAAGCPVRMTGNPIGIPAANDPHRAPAFIVSSNPNGG